MLLLASLAWGSTVEFTHHHGTNAKPGGSLANTAQSPTENEPTQISSSKTSGTSSKSRTGAECLICQLHQNLSTTELGHAPGVGATETCGLKSPADAVVKLSEYTSTGQGRAPPSIL